MLRDPHKALAHVRWLGGAACTGKTAIAERLAADYGLAAYHCDDHFDAHRQQVDPVRHPHFDRIAGRSCDELWMRPAQEQVAELVAFYQEELEMVLDDLAAIRGDRPVLAEGAGLLPSRIGELIRGPGRAVWLQADGALRRRRARRRPQTRELLAQCRDPNEAFRRWMTRDDLFAAELASQARRTGSRLLAVDGERDVASAAAAVARALGLA